MKPDPNLFLQIVEPRKPAHDQEPPVVRLGTVTSTAPLYVQWDGQPAADTVALKRLASYATPVVADRVIGVRSGGSYVLLNKLI
jgi:hypothetical protein